MHITNQSLIDKFIDFVNGISNENRVAVLHDSDADGLTSTIILEKALERMNKNIVFTSYEVVNKRKLEQQLFDKLIDNKVTHVFVLDIALDMDKKSIQNLCKFKSVIIDHHQNGDFNTIGILVIKPQLFTDIERYEKYCTVKLVYDLMSRLIKIDDLEWLAITGIVGDFSWQIWEEFVKKCFKKYNLEWDDYLYNTKFGYLCKLIEGANSIMKEDCVGFAKERIYNSNDIEEAINNLSRFKFVIEKTDYYIQNFKNLAKSYNDNKLWILEVNEPLSMNGAISTGISTGEDFFKDKFVLIVGEREDGRLRLSARCQDSSWDCNKIIKKCLEGLDGNGGGHIPAAGGNVSKEDYQEFKKRIIMEVM